MEYCAIKDFVVINFTNRGFHHELDFIGTEKNDRKRNKNSVEPCSLTLVCVAHILPQIV